MAREEIRLDGSHGEGGGQILRTALALACVTGNPFSIEKIRAARPKPGLRPQHLTGVLAAAKIAEADVEGAQVGSQLLSFCPTGLRGGEYVFDVSAAGPSAGATSLIVQSILLPLCFADRPSQVVLRGGTHVPFSPPFDYLSEVLLPTVGRMGVKAQVELVRPGFYPRGGGEIRLKVEPCSGLNPLRLESRGSLRRLIGRSLVGSLPEEVASRQLMGCITALKEAGLHAQGVTEVRESLGAGTCAFVCAEYENARAGFSALGERGKRAEVVGREAADAFLAFHRSAGAVEAHLADQMVPFLALSEGDFCFATERLSEHLNTNLWTTQQFVPFEFEVSTREESATRVEGRGCGRQG